MKNPLYRNAIDEFHEVYGFYPRIISVDREMDSAENRPHEIAYCFHYNTFGLGR